MQRDYCILTHTDRQPQMVSIHSHDYPTLLSAGYSVLFSGSKKECNAYLLGELEIAC